MKNKKLNANEQPYKFMFDYYIEILISLSLSLLFMNIFYIVFSILTWNDSLVSCMTFGVLLHYCLLNSFCWMLCFSILQYLTFNKVLFVINRYYLLSAIFSFTFPLIPILIVLSINWRYYKQTNFVCWLSGIPVFLGVILPIIIIVLVNLVIFVLILKKHCVCLNELSRSKSFFASSSNNINNSIRKDSNIKRQTVILSTCFVNMGLTWIFGFMLIFQNLDERVKVAFAFLFCIFNSFQGFLMFIIYIVLSKSRRKYFRFAAAEKFRKLKSTISSNEFFDVSSKITRVTESGTLK